MTNEEFNKQMAEIDAIVKKWESGVRHWQPDLFGLPPYKRTPLLDFEDWSRIPLDITNRVPMHKRKPRLTAADIVMLREMKVGL